MRDARHASTATNGVGKAWDARLVEWISRDAGEAKRRGRGSDLLLALPSGLAGGRLVDGEWWWLAALLAAGAVFRFVQLKRKRGARSATASEAR
jgi:hypothetical protein